MLVSGMSFLLLQRDRYLPIFQELLNFRVVLILDLLLVVKFLFLAFMIYVLKALVVQVEFIYVSRNVVNGAHAWGARFHGIFFTVLEV